MNEDQQKELFALVSWLQTFPEFGWSIYNGNESPAEAQRILNSLSTIETARDVAKVATTIINDNDPSQQPDALNTSEQTWTSLLILTSSRARPLPKEPRRDANDNRITPARLKLYVLGNLLDCAVQTQDLRKRRLYIERIMGLTKSVQKTLMSLIEKRGPKRLANNSNSNTPTKNLVENRVNKPSIGNTGSANCYTSISSPPSNSVQSPTIRQQQEMQRQIACMMSPPPSRSASKMSASNHHHSQMEDNFASINMPEGKPEQRGDDDDEETNASSTTECVSNTSTSRSRQIIRYPDKAGRLISAAFSPKGRVSNFTPDQKRCFTNNASHHADERSHLLSPGIMDSPNQLADVVHQLQLKNEDYHNHITRLKQREEELIAKMEEMDIEYRKKLMRVETKGLDRMQDIEQSSKERIDTLTSELETALQQAREGAIAVQELKTARDEIEVLNHGKMTLAETVEKLKKYKEKVCELEDVKEALKKEQDSHAKAVEDLVRLENELSNTKSMKRQLDEYRLRSIEAEVRLVECQDHLRRIQRDADDQHTLNKYLHDGVLMQKEHLEEMHRRIHEETSSMQKDACSKNGVGSGITELNPELNQELIRLKGENLQLRAFAAKRENDAVQHLEESLDDAKRLADRYKTEFLSTKQALAESRAQLEMSLKNERFLKDETKSLQQRADELGRQCESLDQELRACQNELDLHKQKLQASNEENSSLSNDLNMWRKKTRDVEKLSNDRMERLKTVLSDLEETTNNLRSTEELVTVMREELMKRDEQADISSQQLQQLKRRFQQASDDLSDLKVKFNENLKKLQNLESHNLKLTNDKGDLHEQLKIERRLRQEETDEAQRSLEATRELLLTRHEKELDELRSNMNRLLEDERNAARQKDEQYRRKQSDVQRELDAKCKELVQKSTELQQARDEGKLTEEKLRNEFQALLAVEKNSSNDNHDRLIRKGKAMLEEAKTKARDEIQRLDNIVKDLEDTNRAVSTEKADLEDMLQNKISSLEQKLDFSSRQVNSLNEEVDKLQDQSRILEREKFKLQEDNDRFRRQLGGRFGADGKVQLTLENLQKEYNTVLEENRKLKNEAKRENSDVFFTSLLSDDNRIVGSMNGTTLMQLRQEYEEAIESLNDEKRELIMKNSAAVTDVQKAEQRAWEREQEVSNLKAEIVSLKLKLQREDFSRDEDSEHRSFSRPSPETPITPLRSNRSQNQSSSTNEPALRQQRSPGLERAYQQKVAQESELRNRFSVLMRGSSTSRNVVTTNGPDNERKNVPKSFGSQFASMSNGTIDSDRDGTSKNVAENRKHDEIGLSTSTGTTSENSCQSESEYQRYELPLPTIKSLSSNSEPCADPAPGIYSFDRQVARRTYGAAIVDTKESTISGSASSLSSESAVSDVDARRSDEMQTVNEEKAVQHNTLTNNIESSQRSKHEGRFDRWTKGANVNSLEIDKRVGLGIERQSMQQGQSLNKSHDVESVAKNDVRRKSESFQKAASVFGASSPSTTNKVPVVVSSENFKKAASVFGSTISPNKGTSNTAASPSPYKRNATSVSPFKTSTSAIRTSTSASKTPGRASNNNNSNRSPGPFLGTSITSSTVSSSINRNDVNSPVTASNQTTNVEQENHQQTSQLSNEIVLSMSTRHEHQSNNNRTNNNNNSINSSAFKLASAVFKLGGNASTSISASNHFKSPSSQQSFSSPSYNNTKLSSAQTTTRNSYNKAQHDQRPEEQHRQTGDSYEQRDIVQMTQLTRSATNNNNTDGKQECNQS